MEDNFMGRAFWRASELAKEIGVSTDTLRYYERKKVLQKPKCSANGYRMYPLDAPDRVRLVRRALAVGFSVDELALILGERDKGGSPCLQVYRLTAEKLQKVEEQLKVLTNLRDDLHKTLTDWEKRLAASAEGTQSRLLENLPAARKQDGLLRLAPNSKRKKEGYE
jgi:MerR family copper efflux transcriptional regulator